MRYVILNAVSFLCDLELLVKAGELGSKSLYDQGLVINKEVIEWSIGSMRYDITLRLDVSTVKILEQNLRM